MNPTPFDGAMLALAVVIGFVLKNFVFKSDTAANQAIPILNLVAQFLLRLALEVAPAEAGVFKTVGTFAGNLLYESVITTVLASGAQSSPKATGRFFLSVLKQILLQKAAVKVAEEQEKEASK